MKFGFRSTLRKGFWYGLRPFMMDGGDGGNAFPAKDTMGDTASSGPSVYFSDVENAHEVENDPKAQARPDMKRMKSSIRTIGIKQAIEERVANKPSSLKKCAMDELTRLDQDGDGEIDRNELADSVVRMLENAHAKGKQLAYMKLITLLLAVAFVLFALVNFGTTLFAVNEAKDVHVEMGSSVLTTKDDEVVATSTAAVRHLSIGVVAFVPGISSAINHFTIKSDDGTTLEREVAAVDASDAPLVRLHTFLGETLEWEGTETITFTKADGTSFSKHVNCGECSALNVVMTDEIQEGVDDYEKYMRDLHDALEHDDHRRSLQTDSCSETYDGNTMTLPMCRNQLMQCRTNKNELEGELTVRTDPGVTDMGYMFEKAANFNVAIGGWNVSRVTEMDLMFWDATSFNQPIGRWDVSSVTDMTYMFRDATSFNQPLRGWNISNVRLTQYMFDGASSFNQDLSSWDITGKVITDMFRGTAMGCLEQCPKYGMGRMCPGLNLRTCN